MVIRALLHIFSFFRKTARGSGVKSLIDLFYKQEELARAEEQKTDAILDGKKDSEQTETVSTTTKSQEEFIEETVTKCLYKFNLIYYQFDKPLFIKYSLSLVLQKAGRHMEHTLIGAYVVLLLGYLIMDNKVISFHRFNMKIRRPVSMHYERS